MLNLTRYVFTESRVPLCARHPQGAVAAAVGAAPNTGSLAWVLPRSVPAGDYFFLIRPLSGQRRFEVRAWLDLIESSVMGIVKRGRLSLRRPRCRSHDRVY